MVNVTHKQPRQVPHHSERYTLYISDYLLRHGAHILCTGKTNHPLLLTFLNRSRCNHHFLMDRSSSAHYSLSFGQFSFILNEKITRVHWS